MNIVAISVSVDTRSSMRNLGLFEDKRDLVKNFAGIHPEGATREDIDLFREAFTENSKKIDGIGEIGLDKSYDENGTADYASQQKVFAAMLDIAESSGKPISVHSRRSLDDILQLLPSYRLRGVLLHWFAGSKRQLARAAQMGIYVSFGPVLVYSDEKKVLLRNAPRDRVLVETDGPVRYSRCFDDLPASPTSFLVSVVSAVARALEIDYEEAAALLERNSVSYLSA